MHLTSTPLARVKMAVTSMTTAVLGCVRACEIMIVVVFGLTAWIWLQFSDPLPLRIV